MTQTLKAEACCMIIAAGFCFFYSKKSGKRIVINKAINCLNKRKPERMPEDERFDVKEEEEVDVLEGFPFTVEKVRAAIESLPDGYRSVLSLYLLEGYDHGEMQRF